MATYYGKGSKDLIMSKIASLILAINGVKYVDYQRSYDSSISPEKFPGAFVNDVTENKQQILKDVVKNNFTIGVHNVVIDNDDINDVDFNYLNSQLNKYNEIVAYDRVKLYKHELRRIINMIVSY